MYLWNKWPQLLRWHGVSDEAFVKADKHGGETLKMGEPEANTGKFVEQLSFGSKLNSRKCCWKHSCAVRCVFFLKKKQTLEIEIFLFADMKSERYSHESGD